MLQASADDLLQLPGVGPKRRSQLVEMVVDLAADGAPDDVAATEPAFTQSSPTLVATPGPVADPPAQTPIDPTPEELLAAVNAPRYTPVPMQSPGHAPAPTEPAPPEAESFITGVSAMGVLLSGLTAAISGVMTLVNVIRGK